MSELWQTLHDWEQNGPLPFHMPGHKRNRILSPYLDALSAGLDVTELPGLDDLHAPEGLLRDAMARTARLCGSKTAFFLINGSTAGILAGIRAATRRGDRVLVARNCHKAVYHAMELCGLRPVYLQVPLLPDFGCAASLPPETVEAALARWPDARLLILTSPSYEGVLCDLPAIVSAAHRHDVPVFVDEAHGAHLGLCDVFPKGALAAGADLVTQSFHKTLPSLTQTAVLHRCGTRISSEAVAQQLSIFQTSSPSYLLLASLDGCVSFLAREGMEQLSAWSARLQRFSAQTASLRHLRLLGEDEAGVFALDPSKLTIGTRACGLLGTHLAERLRTAHKIQVELASTHYALAMTGLGDTSAQMDALAAALISLDALQEHTPPLPPLHLPPLPTAVRSTEDALNLPTRLCPLAETAGEVSAAALWAYPPGIPLLVPGERLDPALLAHILQLQAAGVKLLVEPGGPLLDLPVIV